MASRQAAVPIASLGLATRRVGPLPLVNHVLDRLGLLGILDRFVPSDGRVRLTQARCLLVLLRSLVVEREPIYREAESVAAFVPSLFGLSAAEVQALGDDRLGRALDHLFDADRGALLTDVVLAMHRVFGVAFDRFHNDSTTVRFCGRYAAAQGRLIRGRPALRITYGYSKDHRPDLKQLLLILTTSDDGHVPVAFRCAAGNTADVTTHRETWDGLCRLAGTSHFLYVADAKLCDGETMDHIARHDGRFLTVLPRSRREDRWFRQWMLGHEVAWKTVRDREGPRGSMGPRDVWRVWRSILPSREGWPVTWVHSSLLASKQGATRQEHIERAQQEIEALSASLRSPRTRLRRRSAVHDRLREILTRLDVTRYLRVKIEVQEVHGYRQTGPGRPGPSTTYRRTTKKHYALTCAVNTQAVERDRRHDGMYPLISNDPAMEAEEVWRQHKRQPRLEARFRQIKDPMAIAPVFLKNEGRIEALFFLYALALLVQALLEREIRKAMEREKVASLPLYPEERKSRFPTATQVLRLFAPLEQHEILSAGQTIKTIRPQLDDLQRQVLRLLGISPTRFG